jgi:hemerythrin
VIIFASASLAIESGRSSNPDPDLTTINEKFWRAQIILGSGSMRQRARSGMILNAEEREEAGMIKQHRAPESRPESHDDAPVSAIATRPAADEGPLRWTPDLSVGVDLIDQQHQELFRRVNQIVLAGKAGCGRAGAASMLEFLEHYVEEHFSTEERWMRASAYPEYTEHRQQHDGFKRELAKLGDLFRAGGAAAVFVIRLNRTACGWLLDHVRKSDMAFGSFLASREAPTGVR